MLSVIKFAWFGVLVVFLYRNHLVVRDLATVGKPKRIGARTEWRPPRAPNSMFVFFFLIGSLRFRAVSGALRKAWSGALRKACRHAYPLPTITPHREHRHASTPYHHTTHTSQWHFVEGARGSAPCSYHRDYRETITLRKGETIT